MGFVKEFREFALKGNVLDLAVGVIIGGAFGTIIKSAIDDLIMPIVSLPGKADFGNWYLPLNDAARKLVDTANAAGLAAPSPKAIRDAGGSVFAYGSFITEAINFAILAFCIFLIVKAFNTARKRFEAEKAAPPPAGPTNEEKLLAEIRDLLKTSR
ncbi:MAG: large conductance mechanosensitive channel protein MscL [Phycisphaerales bacterium]|nr:large conductance mechanosensitive channel protein MscL [Phycisphaerales bacterium]